MLLCPYIRHCVAYSGVAGTPMLEPTPFPLWGCSLIPDCSLRASDAYAIKGLGVFQGPQAPVGPGLPQNVFRSDCMNDIEITIFEWQADRPPILNSF